MTVIPHVSPGLVRTVTVAIWPAETVPGTFVIVSTVTTVGAAVGFGVMVGVGVIVGEGSAPIVRDQGAPAAGLRRARPERILPSCQESRAMRARGSCKIGDHVRKRPRRCSSAPHCSP